MKLETQDEVELTGRCKLIEKMSIGMLTYFDTDGALVSRPISLLEMVGTEALRFFTDPQSAQVEHLRLANLSFIDPAQGAYLSLSGHGEIHTDYARVERSWTPFARPWFPDGPDFTGSTLLKFVPEAAEYWDGSHSRMVRMFAMATSVVVGKFVAHGGDDTLTGLEKPSSNTTSGVGPVFAQSKAGRNDAGASRRQPANELATLATRLIRRPGPRYRHDNQ